MNIDHSKRTNKFKLSNIKNKHPVIEKVFICALLCTPNCKIFLWNIAKTMYKTPKLQNWNNIWYSSFVDFYHLNILTTKSQLTSGASGNRTLDQQIRNQYAQNAYANRKYSYFGHFFRHWAIGHWRRWDNIKGYTCKCLYVCIRVHICIELCKHNKI